MCITAGVTWKGMWLTEGGKLLGFSENRHRPAALKKKNTSSSQEALVSYLHRPKRLVLDEGGDEKEEKRPDYDEQTRFTSLFHYFYNSLAKAYVLHVRQFLKPWWPHIIWTTRETYVLWCRGVGSTYITNAGLVLYAHSAWRKASSHGNVTSRSDNRCSICSCGGATSTTAASVSHEGDANLKHLRTHGLRM
jgi:hypothetical protein